MALFRRWVWVGALATCALVATAFVAGCERAADASRAALAQRRDAWARELGGLRAQQAALAARFDARAGGSASGPAALRTRAVLEGARQSVTDVESQLQQAEARIEQAIRRGGAAGEKAIDEESARARRYLQALAEQMGAAGRQIDQLGRHETEVTQATP